MTNDIRRADEVRKGNDVILSRDSLDGMREFVQKNPKISDLSMSGSRTRMTSSSKRNKRIWSSVSPSRMIPLRLHLSVPITLDSLSIQICHLVRQIQDLEIYERQLQFLSKKKPQKTMSMRVYLPPSSGVVTEVRRIQTKTGGMMVLAGGICGV